MRATWSGEVADLISYLWPERWGARRIRKHIAIICRPNISALLNEPVTELSPTRA